MVKTGLKNETQVGKILVSGSLALKGKNSAGLRVFEQSDTADGIISGKLTRPKYNVSELKKSIDTEIFELIPQTAPILEDTILRSVYNEVTQSVNNLTIEVENLNTIVLNLNSKVSELEIVSESLKIELDNERLKASINENQASVANSQISSTTIDLQNAIQNSLNEAIQRVSLTARNEALVKENESLRDQLFGLNTQVQGGGTAGSSNKLTAKFTGLGEDGNIVNAFAGHKSLPGSAAFTNANKLQINNITADKKITNLQFVVGNGPKWFRVQSGPNTIDAQGQATYDLAFDQTVLSGMKPYIKGKFLGINRWEGEAQEHTNTNLTITATFDDGTTDSVVLNSKLQKNRN